MASEKPLNSKDYTGEDLVLMSTETIGAQPSQKSLWAQAEMQRRLIKSLDESRISTERYNKVLLLLTAMMFLIAVVQLILFSITLPGYPEWARNVGTIMIIVAILFTAFKGAKLLNL